MSGNIRRFVGVTGGGRGAQRPLLAGLRERARRLINADEPVELERNPHPTSTTPANESTMSESHSATAVRIHTAACPSIKLSARGTIDPASANVAERSWRAYHASHAAEMSVLGVTADELCAFLRLELGVRQ
jgi:hypothetical protein